jgi:hypothetical protein
LLTIVPSAMVENPVNQLAALSAMLPCAPTIVPPLRLMVSTAWSRRTALQSPATTLAPPAEKRLALASPYT